jgi:hypothetical protein
MLTGKKHVIQFPSLHSNFPSVWLTQKIISTPTDSSLFWRWFFRILFLPKVYEEQSQQYLISWSLAFKLTICSYTNWCSLFVKVEKVESWPKLNPAPTILLLPLHDYLTTDLLTDQLRFFVLLRASQFVSLHCFLSCFLRIQWFEQLSWLNASAMSVLIELDMLLAPLLLKHRGMTSRSHTMEWKHSPPSGLVKMTASILAVLM